MSSQAVAWAISHDAGSGGAKAALLSIANYANEYGECWASQAILAAGANCSVRQLRRILAGLEDGGLISRERRPGAGAGRNTDIIRLRMRELPVIITARRRDPDMVLDNRQPDIMSGGGKGTLCPGVQGDIMSGCDGSRGGKGTLCPGGNRTMVSANPNTLTSKGRVYNNSPRQFVTAMRDHMSATGRHRTKPADCDRVLPPLLAKHGFEPLLAAAKKFYSTPHALKDGGEYQPGLQVIARDGRLVAHIGAEVADYAKALRIWAASDQTYWDRAEYGPAPNEPGYRGPKLAAGGAA